MRRAPRRRRQPRVLRRLPQLLGALLRHWQRRRQRPLSLLLLRQRLLLLLLRLLVLPLLLSLLRLQLLLLLMLRMQRPRVLGALWCQCNHPWHRWHCCQAGSRLL